MSVIKAMTDKNQRKKGESVRQQGYDGQKLKKIGESVRHQGYDGQKSKKIGEKCPSIGL